MIRSAGITIAVSLLPPCNVIRRSHNGNHLVTVDRIDNVMPGELTRGIIAENVTGNDLINLRSAQKDGEPRDRTVEQGRKGCVRGKLCADRNHPDEQRRSGTVRAQCQALGHAIAMVFDQKRELVTGVKHIIRLANFGQHRRSGADQGPAVAPRMIFKCSDDLPAQPMPDRNRQVGQHRPATSYPLRHLHVETIGGVRDGTVGSRRHPVAQLYHARRPVCMLADKQGMQPDLGSQSGNQPVFARRATFGQTAERRFQRSGGNSSMTEQPRFGLADHVTQRLTAACYDRFGRRRLARWIQRAGQVIDVTRTLPAGGFGRGGQVVAA